MATALAQERCIPCHGGTPTLDASEVEALLAELGPRWALVDSARAIQREIVFKDFSRAVGFINRLAAVAEEQGHHPDVCLHDWNKVTLTLSTHAIGGLSRNDFILAARLDQVVKAPDA